MRGVQSHLHRAPRHTVSHSEASSILVIIIENLCIAVLSPIRRAQILHRGRPRGRGREGFAVVANEVKDLAEETQAAAAEIESQIATVRETNARIDEGPASFARRRRRSRPSSSLEAVVDAVEETNHGVQEISEAAEDQARSTQRAVEGVEDVAAVSGEVATGSEQVSAAFEVDVDSDEIDGDGGGERAENGENAENGEIDADSDDSTHGDGLVADGHGRDSSPDGR